MSTDYEYNDDITTPETNGILYIIFTISLFYSKILYQESNDNETKNDNNNEEDTTGIFRFIFSTLIENKYISI